MSVGACVCSLTPAGSAGARLPAVDLPEALRNIIPLRHGVMRSVSTAEMTGAVGKTLLSSDCMISLDIKRSHPTENLLQECFTTIMCL